MCLMFLIFMYFSASNITDTEEDPSIGEKRLLAI